MRIRNRKKGIFQLFESRHRPVITVLMAVVVFATTYALIMPAITMTTDRQILACAYVLHQHTNACSRRSEPM